MFTPSTITYERCGRCGDTLRPVRVGTKSETITYDQCRSCKATVNYQRAPKVAAQ